MRKKPDIHDQTSEELEETIIALRRKILQLKWTDRELRDKLSKAEERSDSLLRKFTRIQESRE